MKSWASNSVDAYEAGHIQTHCLEQLTKLIASNMPIRERAMEHGETSVDFNYCKKD